MSSKHDIDRRTTLKILGAGAATSLIGCGIGERDERIEETAAALGPSDYGYARAFPSYPSVVQGGVLNLYVSTALPSFRVDVYRQGATLAFVSSFLFTNQSSGLTAPQLYYVPFNNWPSYAIAVPQSWTSGAYVALIVDSSAPQLNTTLQQFVGVGQEQSNAALFVVKTASPASATSILFVLPFFTYHAYNATGAVRSDQQGNVGGNVYGVGNVTSWCEPNGTANKMVTMRRPGGGIGGTTHGAADPNDIRDPSVPPNTYLRYDAPFIQWMESQGYVVDYCADVDLHTGFYQDASNYLAQYRVLVLVGHHEYVSKEMRDHLEAFRDGGGNLAIFGGNTCWWRIHLSEDYQTSTNFEQQLGFRVEKGQAGKNGRDNWWRNENNTLAQVFPWEAPPEGYRPENSLTGVSYRNAGGMDLTSSRPKHGYRLQNVHDPRYGWVFANVSSHTTPVGDGTTIGFCDYLIGYESDGAAIGISNGVAYLLGNDGTPNNFVVLGYALLDTEGLDREWRETCPVYPYYNVPGNYSVDPDSNLIRAATMGAYVKVGTVFNGATTDWPSVVNASLDPSAPVRQITRNVLTRLSYLPRFTAAPSPSAIADASGFVGAYYIAPDGTLKSLSYFPDQGRWTSRIVHGTPGVAIASAPSAVVAPYGYRGVFVIGADGGLYENYQDGSEWNWLWAQPHGLPMMNTAIQCAGAPAAVATSWGYVSVFVVGSDGHVYERYYSNGWNWADRGVPGTGARPGTLAAATGGNGYLGVLVTANNGRTYELANTAPNSTNFGSWIARGTLPRSPNPRTRPPVYGTQCFVVSASARIAYANSDGNLYALDLIAGNGWQRIAVGSVVFSTHPSAVIAPYGYQGMIVGGNDGKAYEVYLSNGSYAISSKGRVPGLADVSPPVMIAAPGGFVGSYFAGADGYTQELYYTGIGSNWAWFNHE